MIVASVSSNRITASVSGSSVTAAVGSSPVTASASGGIGPQGPSGSAGDAGSIAIASASDVELASLTDGDVLRYSSSRWRNYADANLTDGGNF
jgi:hypothetical protein